MKRDVHGHLKTIAIASAIVAAPAPLLAQTPLKSGMAGRITDLTDQGITPEYDAQLRVKAGYYRLRVEPVALNSATVCPATVYKDLTPAQRSAWRNKEAALVDKVFDRDYMWAINADIRLGVQGGSNTSTELALITIKNPKDDDCQIKIGDPATASISYESFLIPINRVNNFGQKIQVNLNSLFTAVTNQKRLNKIWGGVTFLAKVAYPPSAVLLNANAEKAQSIASEELNKNITSTYPEEFSADPGVGQKARKIFVKLDFINMPPTISGSAPAATGGIIIALDYQASVFSKEKFYKPITDTPATLLNTQIMTATGIKVISSALPTEVYNPLRYTATTADGFTGGCSAANKALLDLGLSETDAAIYLWALASSNGNLTGKVADISCLKDKADDLKKVGILLVPPVVTTMATLVQMTPAMRNLRAIMTSGPLDDLSTRFTEQVNLIVEDGIGQRMGLSDYSGRRARSEVLSLISQYFSDLACFAPRDADPTRELPLRPAFIELAAKERATAAIGLMKAAGDTPAQPAIFSLRYQPVALGEVAKIDTISITSNGTDSGKVMTALRATPRPESCAAGWMDPVFASAAP